jgi:uncharacterized protein YndB with AHSA1/START domain
MAQQQPAAAGPEFVIARTFDAPRELVWKAWTEPERFARWFGPKGSVVTVNRLELRPGGICHYALKMPNGPDMWGRFEYREIVPPERLVWVHSFADAAGEPAPSPFGGPWPLLTLSTVTLEAPGDKTTVTIRWVPIDPTAEERAAFEANFDSMQGGWGGTFERLEAYLAEPGGAAR